MDTREHALRSGWYQSKRLTCVLLGALAIGALFLITGHAAQLPGLWPFAFFLLCPLMLLFMMKDMQGMGGGQGGYDGHDGSDQQGRKYSHYIELWERRHAEFDQLPDVKCRVACGDYEFFSSVDIELPELEQEAQRNGWIAAQLLPPPAPSERTLF